jgi:hypothetical protein
MTGALRLPTSQTQQSLSPGLALCDKPTTKQLLTGSRLGGENAGCGQLDMPPLPEPARQPTTQVHTRRCMRVCDTVPGLTHGFYPHTPDLSCYYCCGSAAPVK